MLVKSAVIDVHLAKLDRLTLTCPVVTLPEAEHTTFVRKTVHSTPCGANAKAALPLQALAPSQAGFQGPETSTEGTVYQGFVLFQ